MEKNIAQLNQESILNGHQLYLIERLCDNFIETGFREFNKFKMNVSIGYAYMQTLPGFSNTVEKVVSEQMKMSESEGEKGKKSQIYPLKTIEPGSWKKNDPYLTKKIKQFTQVLSQSLKQYKESHFNEADQ